MNKIYVNLTFINDNFIEKNLQFTYKTNCVNITLYILIFLHFV